jgi:putative serine protease PepD
MSDSLPPFDAPPPNPVDAPPPNPFDSAPRNPYEAPVPPQVTVPGPALPPAAPVQRRRGLGILGTVMVAVIVAAIVGAFAGLAGYVVGRSIDTADQSSISVTTPVASSTTRQSVVVAGSIADIAASTLPSVVSILAEGTAESGSGSGFVIRPNGYILTNNHVVDLVSGGGDLTVVFSDGKRLPGKVVGTNSSYDLAVVKVDRGGLPTVALGDSSGVRVGDIAIAIGAPLGLDGTVTSGIISALDRPVTAGEQTADAQSDVSYINAIQTDAAINPGNSGGPLLDATGAVIGVNSAIASLAVGGEAGNIGLGFAIPSNSAKRIADELIATGRSRTPLMGVQLDMAFADSGARVDTVTAGSAADDAGLEPGDIIVRVDDRSIDDSTELVVAIRSYAPGETVEVAFVRDGQEKTVTLVLGDDDGKS